MSYPETRPGGTETSQNLAINEFGVQPEMLQFNTVKANTTLLNVQVGSSDTLAAVAVTTKKRVM